MLAERRAGARDVRREEGSWQGTLYGRGCKVRHGLESKEWV